MAAQPPSAFTCDHVLVVDRNTESVVVCTRCTSTLFRAFEFHSQRTHIYICDFWFGRVVYGMSKQHWRMDIIIAFIRDHPLWITILNISKNNTHLDVMHTSVYQWIIFAMRKNRILIIQIRNFDHEYLHLWVKIVVFVTVYKPPKPLVAKSSLNLSFPLNFS